MRKLPLALLTMFTALLAIVIPFKSASAASYPNTHTTTIFVHGYHSSYHAEDTMAHYLINHGASDSIIRAKVTKNGKVTFYGHQKANAKNPIIEMDYQANVVPKKSFRENNYAGQMKAVIKADQQRYHTKSINIVGHSMGNMLTIQYLNDNFKDSSLPKVKNLVILAGGDKEPYRQNITSHLDHQLPSNLRVLNVYSNYHGQGSDTVVKNSDSRYWKKTFGHAAKYQEVHLTGLKHSQMHESLSLIHI